MTALEIGSRIEKTCFSLYCLVDTLEAHSERLDIVALQANWGGRRKSCTKKVERDWGNPDQNE